MSTPAPPRDAPSPAALPLRAAVVGMGEAGVAVVGALDALLSGDEDAPNKPTTVAVADGDSESPQQGLHEALAQLARRDAPAARGSWAASTMDGLPPAVRLVLVAAAEHGARLPNWADDGRRLAWHLLEAPLLPLALLLLPDPLTAEAETLGEVRRGLRHVDAAAARFEGGRYVLGHRDAEGTRLAPSALPRLAASLVLQLLSLPPSTGAAGEPGYRAAGLAQAQVDPSRAREAVARRLAAARLAAWLAEGPRTAAFPDDLTRRAANYGRDAAEAALPAEAFLRACPCAPGPALIRLSAHLDDALEAPLARLAAGRDALRTTATEAGRGIAEDVLDGLARDLRAEDRGCLPALEARCSALAERVAEVASEVERQADVPWRALSASDRALEALAEATQRRAADVPWTLPPWAWVTRPMAWLARRHAHHALNEALTRCRHMLRKKLDHTRAALALELQHAALAASHEALIDAATSAGALRAAVDDARDLLAFPELPPSPPPEPWVCDVLDAPLVDALAREATEATGAAAPSAGPPADWWAEPPDPEAITAHVLDDALRRLDAWAGGLTLERVLRHDTGARRAPAQTLLARAVPQLTWDLTRMRDEDLAHFAIRRWATAPRDAGPALLGERGDWDAIGSSPTCHTLTAIVVVSGLPPAALVVAAPTDEDPNPTPGAHDARS